MKITQKIITNILQIMEQKEKYQIFNSSISNEYVM